VTGRLRAWRTRIALAALWLRHAYRFHWAHKPLCDRFRHDVIRLGGVTVCRSCTMVYAGLAGGVVACLVFHGELLPVAPWLFAAVGGVTVAGSLPWWYKRWPRLGRDLLRFSLGLTIALCGSLLVSGHLLAGLIGAAVLGAFHRTYMTLRRGRRLRDCDGCLDLREVGICPGYREQVEHVRRYEIEATELLLAQGLAPPLPRSTEARRGAHASTVWLEAAQDPADSSE